MGLILSVELNGGWHETFLEVLLVNRSSEQLSAQRQQGEETPPLLLVVLPNASRGAIRIQRCQIRLRTAV